MAVEELMSRRKLNKSSSGLAFPEQSANANDTWAPSFSSERRMCRSALTFDTAAGLSISFFLSTITSAPNCVQISARCSRSSYACHDPNCGCASSKCHATENFFTSRCEPGVRSVKYCRMGFACCSHGSDASLPLSPPPRSSLTHLASRPNARTALPCSATRPIGIELNQLSRVRAERAEKRYTRFRLSAHSCARVLVSCALGASRCSRLCAGRNVSSYVSRKRRICEEARLSCSDDANEARELLQIGSMRSRCTFSGRDAACCISRASCCSTRRAINWSSVTNELAQCDAVYVVT
mmetsp:Transcript_14879/g.39852  ORF Transcript_14879/g.39852 Transcript_14879/m.39852 type:complete len:296 (-) Transcript_14879:82-969(-)